MVWAFFLPRASDINTNVVGTSSDINKSNTPHSPAMIPNFSKGYRLCRRPLWDLVVVCASFCSEGQRHSVILFHLCFFCDGALFVLDPALVLIFVGYFAR